MEKSDQLEEEINFLFKEFRILKKKHDISEWIQMGIMIILFFILVGLIIGR